MTQLSLFPEPEEEINPKTRVAVLNHDCKQALKVLADMEFQVDSIVTDPPYELGFMGKSWDSTGIAYDQELWELCLKVLKPGGHLLAFGGSRTYHRMACAIEDAGFEIRDQIMWVTGMGFPKSLNISKAIDKMAGAEREVVGKKIHINHAERGDYNLNEQSHYGTGNPFDDSGMKNLKVITAPATDAAKQWEGWGSNLKPSHEPICMARKPLSEKNIALNVLEHGTGGINVDGCRVGISDSDPNHRHNSSHGNHGQNSVFGVGGHNGNLQSQGRFPANLIHDGSEEVMQEFEKYGERKVGGAGKNIDTKSQFYGGGEHGGNNSYGDTGTAARFFYSAKASKHDRCGSKHPTVKPISLMRYLCRLITPPNGIVLDPFAGTGTTGQAAQEEGFHAVLIEKDSEYHKDILRRLQRQENGER
jgi:DNA modification methylase